MPNLVKFNLENRDVEGAEVDSLPQAKKKAKDDGEDVEGTKEKKKKKKDKIKVVRFLLRFIGV